MATIPESAAEYVRGLREKTIPEFRNRAFEFLLQPGGRGTHESAKDYFHTRGAQRMTEILGNVMPPGVAANLTDTAYLGNEVMAGSLAKLHGILSGKGTPFFSDYGFSWKDVARNRKGEDAGMESLRRRWDEGKYRAEEPTPRTIYRGVE